MKPVITLVCSCLLLLACNKSAKQNTSAPALPRVSKEEGDIIKQKEISVWEYAKTKQFEKLREILADDYISYFNSGVMTPSESINLLRSTTFRDYHLSNIIVKPVANDAAVVYYDVQQDVTGADGVKWIPDVKASSIYVKRNNIWYSVFYQEMGK